MPEEMTFTINDKQLETLQVLTDRFNVESGQAPITPKKYLNNFIDDSMRNWRRNIKLLDTQTIQTAVLEADNAQIAQIKTILGI